MFTIFTPTFNREHTLFRLYESLKRQTYRDFEWIIVDDGSTDHTDELVERWQGEADFPIRYFWQENRGKHVAFNRGVREARGEFFLSLDSDDACLPHALERFKFYWDSIPSSQKEFFSGVCALCQDQEGKLIGNRFPFDVMDSNSLEVYYRYKVRGDKWGFQRTEVLRRYPFPEIDGVKFIPEGIVWNEIAKSYRIRFVNEILSICYTGTGSYSDRLTNSLNNTPKYAKGCALYYAMCLNENMVWFRNAPLDFIRFAVHYSRFSLHTGKGLIQTLSEIKAVFAKILIVLAFPIGIILYACEKRGVNLVLRYKSVLRR